MKVIGNTLLAIIVLVLLGALLFMRQGNRNPLCEPALYLGAPGNHPEEIVTDIIDELGGLPQQDTNLLDIQDPRIVAPVADWQIRSAVVQNGNDDFAATLLDDDPVMRYTIDLDVHWEDGASGILQWTSWRYGLVSCPVAFPKGSGPLGAIRVVALTPAPPPPEETPETTPQG